MNARIAPSLLLPALATATSHLDRPRATGAPPSASVRGAVGAPSSFRDVLRGALLRFSEGQSVLASSLDRAISGPPPSPADLLALQATVNRYAHELDLASRLVDRATGAVKQTMQAQS